MTSWVIDASVIIKWIIPNPKSEPFTPQALDILEHIQEGQITVFQPPHWLSEVAAVLARIVPNRAEQAIGLLYAMEFSVLAVKGNGPPYPADRRTGRPPSRASCGISPRKSLLRRGGYTFGPSVSAAHPYRYLD